MRTRQAAVAAAMIMLSMLSTGVRAQAAAAPGATAAPVSAAKKELVNKVLQLQQSGYDAFATQLVLNPAAQMQQQLRTIVQRAPAAQRDALARELEADLLKYADEVTPIARDAARRLAPLAVAPILEQQLTEDELREVVRLLESPAHRKFLALSNDMQRAVAERIVAETRPQVQPKMQALEQSVTRRLSAAMPAAAGSAPSR